MTSDPAFLAAHDMTAQFREGSLSPVEVTEACFDAIDRHNPELNAFVVIDREGALAEARASEERWHIKAPKSRIDGVPTTIKDIILTQGWPARFGSHASGEAPAAVDAPVSARLREHGAVLMGSTTTPEYGWKGVTDSALTGITRNPWDPSKTPGGSSGGAAAGIASGMSALAVGTDGGGSIRIPAGFTGIFGLKPSFGRVPAHPASPFGTVAHLGPMTRNVTDAALMLTVITRPDPRNWHPLPPDNADYTHGLDDGIEGLKIAYSPSLGGERVDPEIAALVHAAVQRFTEMGAKVEEADPDLTGSDEIFRTHWFAGAANLFTRFTAEQTAKMDPGLKEIAAQGAATPLLDYMGAMNRRRDLQLTMSRFHEDFDLLLTPTLPIPAFDVGLEFPPDYGNDRWCDWTPFSYPFNLTQQPAATVPCGLTGAGLPAGLQIVGPIYSDALVLRAARAFEIAAPWSMPAI